MAGNLNRHTAATPVPSLLPSNPDHLHQLGPEPDGRLQKGSLVRVDCGTLPDQIDCGRVDELGALEGFPAKKEDRREEQHCVVDEEVVHAPWGVACITEDLEGSTLVNVPCTGIAFVTYANQHTHPY